MTHIATVIGTDGSGKTTLSEAVVDALRADGLDASREWLGAESYAMRPVRSLLKMLWRRRKPGGAAQTSGYSGEVASKSQLASRLGWARRIYLALVFLDYRGQLALKLRRSRRRDIVLADRYVFDVVVNAALALGWTPEQTVSAAHTRLAKVPLPRVRVFLRVEPEISMSRKDDIPDIDYLRLRLSHYDAIAHAFGFTVLDGTLPIEQNADWLLRHIRTELDRPSVLYVHANNQDVGGADKVLALMAAHMRAPASGGPGYATAVTLREPTSILAGHRASGTPVVLHPFVRPQVSQGPRGLATLAVRGPSSLWYFWRLFGRNQPDLVHVNDLYDFIPALAAKARRIPVAYHMRMIKSGRIARGFSVLVPWLSTSSVSVSEAVRSAYFADSRRPLDVVIRDLGNASLRVGADSVREPAARPSGVPEGGRFVVMVGRLEEWKGQHVFLEAVRHLPDEVRLQHSFALVGGSVPGKEAYAGRIAAEAHALGVACLGVRSDVPDLLRAADISVHCSIEPDPLPGVVIESLLAGAATIGADAGGVPEMINDQAIGVLTPPGDPGALAAALLELLSDSRAPRLRYADAARARALELTDPIVIDGEMDRLYQCLTRQNHQTVDASTR